MAVNISFEDFDTVCYSNQHNIIELINHSVGLSIEINIQSSQIDSINADIQGIQGELDQISGDTGDVATQLRRLTTRVDDLEDDLTRLRREYDLFAYAVNEDLKSLSDRITALGG